MPALQASRKIPPFAALKAFEAFGDHGGMRRAAQALGISHAIVSRHMRSLESWLGVDLLQRDGGGLTPLGREYHARVRHAVGLISEATEAVMRRSRDRLEIWCAPGFAYLWLGPRMGLLQERAVGLAYDLRPAETMPDLLAGQADIDIRYHLGDGLPVLDGNLRALALASPSVFPVASPEFVARYAGKIHGAGDLHDLPLLDEIDASDWSAWFKAQGVEEPVGPATARLWQAHLTLAAARGGQGIALTNHFLAAPDLARGAVVLVKPVRGSFKTAKIGTYILTARADRWTEFGLRLFRQWLTGEIEKEAQD